jgi:hypothetical protein
MKVRPTGVLAIEQKESHEQVRNDRIVAVPAQAERMTQLAEIGDLGVDTLKQLEVLFARDRRMGRKANIPSGLEEITGCGEANRQGGPRLCQGRPSTEVAAVSDRSEV